MFGFRFDEDHDADKFRKRVASRVQITGAPSPHVCVRHSSVS